MSPNPPRTAQLSWVAPMYRTRDFLEPLCERIGAASAALGLEHEILLVDDACPEGSADAAERIAARYPLRLVRLPRIAGQDSALRAGLRQCCAPWVVILDADLQDPPEAVASLWSEAQRGFDVVFANRHGRYESCGRLLTSRLYRRLASILGGLPEGAGLFALINRKTYLAVAGMDDAPVSLLAALARVHGRYSSVPVLRSARSTGASAYGGLDRLRKAARSLLQLFLARHGRRRPAPDA